MQGTSLDIVQDLINQLKQVVPQAFTGNKLDAEVKSVSYLLLDNL